MKKRKYILFILIGVISITAIYFGGILTKALFWEEKTARLPYAERFVTGDAGIELEDFLWYSELWAKYLEPITTEAESDQLESIDWDEKLRPYMEYDWIGDERIEKTTCILITGLCSLLI